MTQAEMHNEYVRLFDELDLTQRRGAELLGITEATLSARLCGHTPIKQEAVDALRWWVSVRSGVGG